MKNTIAAFCAAAIAVVTFGAAPVTAAPLQFGDAQFTNAQFSFSFGTNNDSRRDRFERRGNSYYYNGYRGQRERRSGWRFYNGFYFPQSAFSFSFSIGDERPTRMSSRHRDWCEDNYRSYRASDNTFQPYHGSRQECFSPYSR